MSIFTETDIIVKLDNGQEQGVHAGTIEGSGLAYVQQKDGQYAIIHIASGLALLEDIPYVGKVQRIMLRIVSLYDWTRPIQQMKAMDIPPELYQVYLDMHEIKRQVIYGGQ